MDNTHSLDGNFIKSTRKALGLTQREFAAAAGISEPTIVALEKGARSPQAIVVEKIERLLRGRGMLHAPWTPDEADLLENYRSLSKNSKANILGVVRAMEKDKKRPEK